MDNFIEDEEKEMEKALGDIIRQEGRLIKRMLKPIKQGEELEYYLDRLSKDELNNLRKRLDVKNASTLSKAKLIDVLSNEVVNEVDFIVKNLGAEEFKLLEAAVKSGGKIKDDFQDYDSLYSLQEWGIAFFGTDESLESILIIPQELVIKVKSCFKDKQLMRKVSHLHECFSILKGYLYYYGVFPSDDLHSLLRNNLAEEEFYDFITYIFNNIGVDKDIDFFGGYFCHWNVADPEHIINEHRSRLNLKYAEIPCEMAIEASDDDYREENEYAAKLLNFFTIVGEMTLDEAEEMVDVCIDEIKNDVKLTEIINFIGDNIRLPGIKAVEEMMGILQNLYNSIRKWALKGHTSNEVFEEEKKFLRPFTKKIGRNEPCPCGSGKKYKHCCGR